LQQAELPGCLDRYSVLFVGQILEFLIINNVATGTRLNGFDLLFSFSMEECQQ
jgi:hypothetical protein